MFLKITNDCHILNGKKGYNALKKPSPNQEKHKKR